MTKTQTGFTIYGVGALIFVIIYIRRVILDYMNMAQLGPGRASLSKCLKDRKVGLATIFMFFSWLSVLCMAYFLYEDWVVRRITRRKRMKNNVSEQLNSMAE